MALSDRIVFQTLEKLIAERGDQVISQAEIAAAAEISLRSVGGALRRLMHEQRIIGEFETGIGYKYRIADGRTPERRTA